MQFAIEGKHRKKSQYPEITLTSLLDLKNEWTSSLPINRPYETWTFPTGLFVLFGGEN